ncbi:hypothetical protein M0638_21915 [Roseomonas sp. NAR14]|uniref:Uncharacterized protein n=1 Tax=Roseomonas acroporae TaxID=2937791 RepID=A0A9X2BZH6_9PROT|nr:hypothetical protein [Roseomonas acroporae]MCK8787035.1 hypothetical protein [Roseomonas acroporae]
MDFLEDRIRNLPNFESLDIVLPEVHKKLKADYVFLSRACIIEQKSIRPSRELNEKGKAIENFFGEIDKKYGAPPDVLWRLMSVEEKKRYRKLLAKFTDGMKRGVQKAPKQIAWSRARLGVPNAYGIILLIMDNIPGVIPQVVHALMKRIHGNIQEKVAPGERIDALVCAFRMKDFSIGGRRELFHEISLRPNDEDFSHCYEVLLKTVQGRGDELILTPLSAAYFRTLDLEQHNLNLFD